MLSNSNYYKYNHKTKGTNPMNTSIIWTKIDSRNQKCEINGITYYATRKSLPLPNPFVLVWCISVGHFDVFISNEDLRTAKKEFAVWLEAQQPTDADECTTQTTEDLLAEDELARTEAGTGALHIAHVTKGGFITLEMSSGSITERRATQAQCDAIHKQLQRWSTRRAGYEQKLMKQMFGRTVDKVSDLSVGEASTLEIHLARLARTAYNHSSLTWSIHIEIDIFLKFNAYPTDPARAKATYNLMLVETAYSASEGRTGSYKHLTCYEATVYANSLERQLATLTSEYQATVE